jgi:hypothetical protein
MRTFDIPMYEPVSAENGRAFGRSIKAGAVIGSILAAGLVAVTLLGPTSPGHAVTAGAEASKVGATAKPAERSGVRLGYAIVF